jgi:hypothetical protein
MITKSAECFFSSLIDYAGLFPPAGLSIEKALSNYCDYRQHPQRWILSRFILTPAHLSQISSGMLSGHTQEQPLDLSLVCKDPLNEIPLGMKRISELNNRISIGSIEVSLSAGRVVSEQIRQCDAVLNKYDSTDKFRSLFFEIPPSPDWAASLPEVVDSLKAAAETSNRSIGFKLRCGGTEPHLVPSFGRVADAISACAQSSVPIKFTAGLHHPFRAGLQDGGASCQTPSMHGYFNVFFAAFAAFGKGSPASKIMEILTCQGDVRPEFGEEYLEWLGIRFSLSELKKIRTSLALSFGSCSFVEPLEDASALNWL